MGCTATRLSAAADHAERLADARERLQGSLQFVTRMGCRDDGPDASLIAGDGWEDDRLREHTLLEKLGGEIAGEGAVTRNDRCNRRLAGAGIEAEIRKA